MNESEVDDFSKKVEVIRSYEIDRGAKEGFSCKIHAWLVTNATIVNEEARKLAKKRNINLKYAVLPRKWMKDAYWKIKEIKDL